MFNVEEANRDPAIAVNIQEEGKFFLIPDVGEVKEYGRNNNLNYSIPRFVGKTHSYICSKYKGKHNHERWITAINPIILKTEGFVFVEETQHGVEGIYIVPRHPKVLVAYVEAATMKPVQRELMGLASFQFQQAIQAVSGLFISDFGYRIDNNEEYKQADEETQNKMVTEYLKELKTTLDEEIEQSPETKSYVKATQFLAEKIEMANASEGVLPVDITKKLEAEADEADLKASKPQKK